MRLPFFTVDVFTTRRFAGNPLAIVEDADRLTAAQMQTIAREFNLSETIFIQSPENPANTAKVRIFFPTAEIPFAGHPTIGCAIHLALKANPGDGDFDTTITLEEIGGLVPVRTVRKAGAVVAQLTAPILPVAGAGEVPDARTAAAALGLSDPAIGFGSHRPWQGGPTFVFLPLANAEALAAARPSEPAWSKMLAAARTNSVYCYIAGGHDPATAFRARMFAPADGIAEDPATGSASSFLAAQLLASGELKEGLNAFRLEQGYEMGRPSDLFLEAEISGGRLTAARIAGSSVAVSEGWLEV